MRFDLQQNFRCPAPEHPRCLPPENGGAVTTVDLEDIYRFEGEGGPETPVPNLVDVRSTMPFGGDRAGQHHKLETKESES